MPTLIAYTCRVQYELNINWMYGIIYLRELNDGYYLLFIVIIALRLQRDKRIFR